MSNAASLLQRDTQKYMSVGRFDGLIGRSLVVAFFSLVLHCISKAEASCATTSGSDSHRDSV